MSRRLPPIGFDPDADWPMDPRGWSFTWRHPRYARPEPPRPWLWAFTAAELRRLCFARWCYEQGLYAG